MTQFARVVRDPHAQTDLEVKVKVKVKEAVYPYLLGSCHTLVTGLRALPRSWPWHLGSLDTRLMGSRRGSDWSSLQGPPPMGVVSKLPTQRKKAMLNTQG